VRLHAHRYAFSADTGFINLWYLSLQIREEGGAWAQLKINEQQRQIAERDRQLEEVRIFSRYDFLSLMVLVFADSR
jgi:hypothetical protein